MRHTVTFIGGGNMARAMIGGLHHRKSKLGIRVSEPNHTARKRLAEDFEVQPFTDNLAAVAGTEVVVLAVKPQIVPEVLDQLAAAISADQLVLSIAAGIACRKIESALADQQAIIRAMPNTPAFIGLGITALFANLHCTDHHKALAAEILAATGDIVWIEDEALMDVVTALSGSGPAYFYFLIEAMRDAGVSAGLEFDIASQLAIKTAVGASQMADQSELDVANLRHQVTSPGGTTEAAISMLLHDDFNSLIKRAIMRATERGRELSD